MHFVSIIEEEECSQYRTFPHALRAREVNIAIELHLGIRDIGAVQKDNLVQVFHTSGISSSL